MGKNIVVPSLDVIMIAFFPINATVKDHSSFFGVSTILFLFFSRCIESVSDFFFSLLIGCTGSLSMGERGMRMTVNWSSAKFKMT